MYLDEIIKFNLNIEEKMSKAMKCIDIVKKLSDTFPRHSVATLYKSFLTPHLDYGDIIYDQPNNENFPQKIERIQYNATLTGAIKETSQNKLYSELSFESLKFRTTGIPEYSSDIIPQTNHLYNTRFLKDVTTLYNRTVVFKYSIFPSTILEWNKLDKRI